MRFRYRILTVALTLSLTILLTAGLAASKTPTVSEEPMPSIVPAIEAVAEAAPAADVARNPVRPPQPFGAPPLNFFFPGFDFDDNGTLAGTYYIPPDPIGASGPFHVVNVGNTMIQWFTKNGVLQYHQSLNTFFNALGPPLGTNTFDPKVIYDQYSERFVVITLERSSSPQDSYILVAVSMTSDPNMGWYYLAINSKLNIGGADYWADYPGLAVGPNAIYITNNMFGFAGGYGGSRLWIVHKSPFYTGGVPVWTLHDPYAAAGSATTTQPSHMFGAVPGGMGTFLCSYSGLTDGTNEYVQVVQVLNPLGAVTFNQQFVMIGDIEGPSFPALPDAPQLGSTVGIEVNDRRALNAVWRDNALYVSTTILPNSGPDVNETTAHWFKLNATGVGSITPADQGDVGANDLGAGTYTFFPSVMVDKCGNMGIGFSASNSQIYPGAYYTGRLAADPAGTVQSTGTLAAGQDYYVRTFNSGRNRWGDYSGISLDPADEVTFWVFNEYAMTRGTPLGSPPEDGRWATMWGSYILGCQPVAVAITGFEARVIDGGVELLADLAADSDRYRVDVYRSSGGAPVMYKSIDYRAQEPFRFVDRYVEPGQTYTYHLAVEDKDGRFVSPTSTVSIPVQEAVLLQNKPNPFNPVTSIRFVLPQTQRVTLSVFDSQGKLVNVLVDEVRGSGPHEVEWTGTDLLGNRVSSGVYFYRLDAGDFRMSRKMLLLK
jgi:hypothetical protein